MTVNEALQNIDVVVANARMNRQEHDALRQSLGIVAQRCKDYDELKKDHNELVTAVQKEEAERIAKEKAKEEK